MRLNVGIQQLSQIKSVHMCTYMYYTHRLKELLVCVIIPSIHTLCIVMDLLHDQTD